MMKRIIVSLFISIYMLSSIAADTSYVGNFPADGQAAEAVLYYAGGREAADLCDFCQ